MTAILTPAMRLLLQAEREHARIPSGDVDIAVRQRQSAVVIPAIHGIAARIDLIAGRPIESIEHRVSRLASAREARPTLLAAFRERTALGREPSFISFEASL